MSNELKDRLDKWLIRCEEHVGMDMYAQVARQGIDESDLMVKNVIDLALERIEELEHINNASRPTEPKRGEAPHDVAEYYKEDEEIAEPKTKIAEGLKALAWTKQGNTSLLDLVDDEIILHQPTEKIERNSIDCVLDALLAICDEVES